MKLIQCDNCPVQVALPPNDHEDHEGVTRALDGWVTATLAGIHEHEVAPPRRRDSLESLFTDPLEAEADSHKKNAGGIFHSWPCMVEWIAKQEQAVMRP